MPKMRVYKLYCKELGYCCIYNDIDEMLDEMKTALEQDEAKLDFEIEPSKMTEKAYEALPESSGW